MRIDKIDAEYIKWNNARRKELQKMKKGEYFQHHFHVINCLICRIDRMCLFTILFGLDKIKLKELKALENIK
jgi:hypothetical protein